MKEYLGIFLLWKFNEAERMSFAKLIKLKTVFLKKNRSNFINLFQELVEISVLFHRDFDCINCFGSDVGLYLKTFKAPIECPLLVFRCRGRNSSPSEVNETFVISFSGEGFHPKSFILF